MKYLAGVLSIWCALTVAAADVSRGEFGASAGNSSKKQTEKKTETGQSKRTTYPFYGTLDSVDESAGTLTIRGKKKNRIILVTSETRVQKEGSEAKLVEGSPGERVSGSVRKNQKGQEEAVTVRFGAKPSTE